MKETMLSVTAIRTGTVIDHILNGQGMRIVRLLKIQNGDPITIGLNLKSSLMGLKDLIKIENIFLTKAETAQIALFAPKATVNVIEDYRVVSKYQVELPEEIEGLLRCANSLCITRMEKISPSFSLVDSRGRVSLRCRFCEKVHHQEDLTELHRAQEGFVNLGSVSLNSQNLTERGI